MTQKKILFPSVCFDNFYDNPLEVRNWALSLPFDDPNNDTGVYPGTRTRMLHEINQLFFDSFSKKLLSIFFDLQRCDIKWNIQTHFQLITPYSDPDLNKAWVHNDDGAIFGGVIYLDDNNDPEAGTSIGDVNFSNVNEEEFNNLQDIRKKFYKGEMTDESEINDFKRLLTLNNEAYTVTAEYKNKFNRLICFDSNQQHKANFATNKKTRLTQVFFVNGVETDSAPPVIRSKEYQQIINFS